MNDIEKKALIERLRQRSNSNYMLTSYPPKPAPDRDCHAAADLLEQLLPIAQEFNDFRQEVSDAVGDTLFMVETHCDGETVALVSNRLMRFIIPAPKPDPLVEVLHEVDTGPEWDSPEDYCNKIRAALEARGLEIREKNDG